jgi:hypothetical protein
MVSRSKLIEKSWQRRRKSAAERHQFTQPDTTVTLRFSATAERVTDPGPG